MSDLSDLLERFRRGAEVLAMATTGAAGPVMEFQTPEHKRTVRQLVCGLADHEIAAALRIRQLIAEDNPTLAEFDENAWVANLDYGKRKVSQALENFRRLRTESHELLKELPEATFARAGKFASGEATTLRDVVDLYASHLEEQIREIQAVRAAFRDFKAQQAAQAASPTVTPAQS